MAQFDREKTPILVSFLLYLARSKRYNKFKDNVKDFFSNSNNSYKQFLDYFLIFLIVTSVAIFVYEVTHKIPRWMEIYAVYFTSIIFALEYLINMWIYWDIRNDILKEYNEANFLKRPPRYWRVFFRALRKNLRYILTPIAIIDLLAIMPMYRPLRMLRIFVLFRFLKIFKHSKKLHQFVEVVYSRRFEFLTLFALFVFVIFAGAIAIYITEQDVNKDINSLFDAVYWSYITITTVGYGDVTPVTTVGKVVSFVIVILGLTIVSFGTSVIVSAFLEKLNRLKEESIANHLLTNEDYYIICGYGHLSKRLVKFLEEEKRDFIILDRNMENVQEAIDDGYFAICDDPAKYEVLKRFYRQDSYIKVLALTGSDIENTYISLNAKSISKDIFVVARASRRELINKFNRAGADRVVFPNDLAAFMMEASVAQPVMYKALSALLNFREVAIIDELYVDSDSLIIDKTIEEARFDSYRIVVFGVQKGLNGKFFFNPSDDYVLKENDIVVVTSNRKYIEYYQQKNRLKRNIWKQ